MKTLIKYANAKRIPALGACRVKDGIGAITDLDMSIYAPVDLPDGIYQAASLGGLNLAYEGPADDLQALTDAPQGTGQALAVTRDSLEWLLIAVSSEKTRYYLNGIYYDGESGVLVSTDGHRLHKESGHVIGGTSVIIPRGAVKAAIALMREYKVKECRIVTGTNNRATITCGPARIVTKTIDGDFPPYERVITKNNNKAYVWDNSAYMQIFKQLKAALGKDMPGVKLNGHLECGIFKFDFPPCPIEIGFNGRYLAALESGDMRLGDACGPVVVTHDPRRLSVLMPMRI